MLEEIVGPLRQCDFGILRETGEMLRGMSRTGEIVGEVIDGLIGWMEGDVENNEKEPVARVKVVEYRRYRCRECGWETERKAVMKKCRKCRKWGMEAVLEGEDASDDRATAEGI